jgi:hypothetical protein
MRWVAWGSLRRPLRDQQGDLYALKGAKSPKWRDRGIIPNKRGFEVSGKPEELPD